MAKPEFPWFADAHLFNEPTQATQGLQRLHRTAFVKIALVPR